MKRVFRWLDWTALLILLWTGAALVPLSFWFKPGNLVIASTNFDEQPALVIYDRQIKRRVFMRYAVVVHRLVPDLIACEAEGGPFWFEPSRQLPEPSDMTLAWFAPGDPRCARLPPGEYIAEACWTATVASLLPSKSVCIQSNPFTIKGETP